MTTAEKTANSFLGLREAFCQTEMKRRNAAAYDTPCESFENTEEEILFYLYVFKTLDCFTESQLETLFSRANRVSRNCGNCTVSAEQIAEWLLSEEGIAITSKLP